MNAIILNFPQKKKPLVMTKAKALMVFAQSQATEHTKLNLAIARLSKRKEVVNARS